MARGTTVTQTLAALTIDMGRHTTMVFAAGQTDAAALTDLLRRALALVRWPAATKRAVAQLLDAGALGAAQAAFEAAAPDAAIELRRVRGCSPPDRLTVGYMATPRHLELIAGATAADFFAAGYAMLGDRAIDALPTARTIRSAVAQRRWRRVHNVLFTSSDGTLGAIEWQSVPVRRE